MNTQRPEWNDANNALVGDGVSVVTLCYLRRYLALPGRPPGAQRRHGAGASRPRWPPGSARSTSTLTQEADAPGERTHLDRRDRKRLMDAPGRRLLRLPRAGLRGRILGTDRPRGRRGRRSVPHGPALGRPQPSPPTGATDGLYHAYNLLEIGDGGAAASHRPPAGDARRPGRRAQLRRARLRPRALEILERLFASDLYRPDQRSFMLYPERELPGLPGQERGSRAGAAGDSPVARSAGGRRDRRCSPGMPTACVRFHGDLAQRRRPGRGAGPRWRRTTGLVGRASPGTAEPSSICSRRSSSHRSYTGPLGDHVRLRGAGLHLLAHGRQAAAGRAGSRPARRTRRTPAAAAGGPGAACTSASAPDSATRRSVAEYGAFPTDPYSHTPARRRRQAAGHDRSGEGRDPHPASASSASGSRAARSASGRLCCGADEFLEQPAEFPLLRIDGRRTRPSTCPAGSLAFTCCQVPVIFRRTAGPARSGSLKTARRSNKQAILWTPGSAPTWRAMAASASRGGYSRADQLLATARRPEADGALSGTGA